MVDISNKLEQIKELIDNEFYFTINKPRQYGKTTTISELKKKLKEEYVVITISFEGIGDKVFSNEEEFSNVFVELLCDSLELSYKEESKRLISLSGNIKNIRDLSKVITNFIKDAEKEVILFIDEVDKSSNNQLFLSFIGMLRNKYLAREIEEDFTFKSVILAGLYDVKSLKLKIRNEEEAKYNSPWNIAVDFNVDMSFSPNEISTMLKAYCAENSVSMDIDKLSEELYFFTSGYPFLVSRLCQIIDEKIYGGNKGTFESSKEADDDLKVSGSRDDWNIIDIQEAVKMLLEEKNTLFDSLIKNLENNRELYDYIEDIIVRGNDKSFNSDNPLIELGMLYGYFKNIDGKVKISNKIFAERIYNYMVSKLENNYNKMAEYNFKAAFIKVDGSLNIEKILKRFQQFMHIEKSTKCNQELNKSNHSDYLEANGRLLFLAFIKPIINGAGFDFKEVQVSEEKRLDVVITYNSFKYIIEMKIWRGLKYHEDGVKQLWNYLDIHGLDNGYLLIFDFNKNKEFKEDKVNIQGKEVFEVYV